MVRRARWLILPLVAGVLLPGDAAGQRILGRVLDDATGDPLGGVLVEIADTRLVTTTDLTGTFRLDAAAAGRVRLRLLHRGYRDLVSDTIEMRGNETTAVLLRMVPVPIPIDPVIVVASRARHAGFYERLQEMTAGQYITQAEIEKRPGIMNTTELLRSVPGVEIVPIRRGRASAGANLVTMRGPMGRCQPAVFIDGMPLRQFPESGLDDLLKPHMIEGVEIYSRGITAPPQFGAPPSCGVIVFWTRSGSGEGARKWPLKRILAAAGIAATMVAVLALAQ